MINCGSSILFWPLQGTIIIINHYMFLFIRTNTLNLYNYFIFLLFFLLHWPTYEFFHIKASMLVYFFAASLFYPIFRFFAFIPFSFFRFLSFLTYESLFSRKFSLIFYSMYNRVYICTRPDNIQFIRFFFSFLFILFFAFLFTRETLKHSLGTYKWFDALD
jgi:hypothetical protein